MSKPLASKIVCGMVLWGLGGVLFLEPPPLPANAQPAPTRQSQESLVAMQQQMQDLLIGEQLPADEIQAILAWAAQNQLNPYGDPLDTVYTGGSPLFDETTGETCSLYPYLLKNHPTRPWRTE